MFDCKTFAVGKRSGKGITNIGKLIDVPLRIWSLNLRKHQKHRVCVVNAANSMCITYQWFFQMPMRSENVFKNLEHVIKTPREGRPLARLGLR